jgi:hypothetical protein
MPNADRAGGGIGDDGNRTTTDDVTGQGYLLSDSDEHTANSGTALLP